MAAITLSHVVKKYGDGYPAVNDVSLDVDDGEFVILVGPSGCGKSTLLRMVVGLEDISDGELTIDDEVVNDTLREKALIGQFDMITSLVGDRYRIVIGDPRATERGGIYPAVESGGYDEYLEKQVLPVVCGSKDDRVDVFEALHIERVEHELADKEPYEVNIAIEAGGEVYYKRFVF